MEAQTTREPRKATTGLPDTSDWKATQQPAPTARRPTPTYRLTGRTVRRPDYTSEEGRTTPAPDPTGS